MEYVVLSVLEREQKQFIKGISAFLTNRPGNDFWRVLVYATSISAGLLCIFIRTFYTTILRTKAKVHLGKNSSYRSEAPQG